jgi:hypothetical protein
MRVDITVVSVMAARPVGVTLFYEKTKPNSRFS